MTSRLGTGISKNFFYGVLYRKRLSSCFGHSLSRHLDSDNGSPFFLYLFLSPIFVRKVNARLYSPGGGGEGRTAKILVLLPALCEGGKPENAEGKAGVG